MGSNWAQEFRNKVEGSEGKYRAAEDLGDVDGFLGEEEETGFEEPRDEIKDEIEDKVERETDETKQEPEKAKIEEPAPKREETASEYRYRLLIESAKSAPAQSEGNTTAAIGACLMAMMVFMVMPLLFNTFTRMLQLFAPGSYSSLYNPYSSQAGW